MPHLRVVLSLLTVFCILNFCCPNAADARPKKEVAERVSEPEEIDVSDTAVSDRDKAKQEKERKILSKQKLYTPFVGQTSDEIIKTVKTKNLTGIEGIWSHEDGSFEVAILKNEYDICPGYDYIGIVVSKSKDEKKWKIGELKLKMKASVSEFVFIGEVNLANKSEQHTTFVFKEGVLCTYSYTYTDFWVGIVYNVNEILIKLYPKKDSQTSELGQGTGFFISDNLVATCYHVIKDVKKIYISKGRDKAEAFLLFKDKSNDIAILEVKSGELTGELAGIRPIGISNINEVGVGDAISVAGYPLSDILGANIRLTTGIVNSMVGMDDDPRLLQISAEVQPGNSGGPLLNGKGEVVGIVVSKLSDIFMLFETGQVGQGVNFAVKINYLKELLSLLPKGKYVLPEPSADSRPMKDVMTAIVQVKGYENDKEGK